MGKTSALKEKWENPFNGRQLDDVQGEIPEALTTDLILVSGHNHPLLLQQRRRGLTEESFANMAI